MKNKNYKQQLLVSIAEAKGYEYDKVLIDSETKNVVAISENEIAKVLLGQMTTKKDIATVESILSVISKLPNYEKLIESVKIELVEAGFAVPKLLQIESQQTGTPGWFRRLMNSAGF
jgi:hypothetical protein